MSAQPKTKLKLYEHDSAAILPLLTRYLPHTQSILGAIVSSPPPGSQPQGVLDAPPLESILASFPPDDFPSEDDRSWIVAVALPAPSEQVRIWHRAEVELNEAEIERVKRIEGSAVSPSTLRPDVPQTQEVQEAAEAMIEARKAMREKFTQHFVMGQLNAAWEPALREALHAPSRGICRCFLAPSDLPPTSSAREHLEKLGLKFDHTRVGDEPEMSRLTKYHPPKYVLSRSAYTTLVRPVSGGPPVCWVMTHADGSIGALYTLPEWRRKGLAKIVVAERLRSMAETPSLGRTEEEKQLRAEASRKLRANLQVEENNEASEALWKGLGWEPAWSVGWVYSREDQEKYRPTPK